MAHCPGGTSHTMPTTTLPAALAELPFAGWTVDRSLVIEDALVGGGLPGSLDLRPGIALDLRHPAIAGLLREAAGGETVRRRVLLDDIPVLLDARPRVGGGAVVMVVSVPDSGPRGSGLTERQLEVLHLLCLGLTSRQIAQRLWIAETTVENHLRVVYRRLGCRTRAEAVSRAFRLGLVDPAVLDAVDSAT
ncbi:MAG: Nitrogen regulation protein [Actinomycetota bacterium]